MRRKRRAAKDQSAGPFPRPGEPVPRREGSGDDIAHPFLRRAWPALAIAAILLLTAALIARACYFRSDVYFLADHRPALWIIYPLPAGATIHPGVALDTEFRRSFTLEAVPVAAQLRVCAFRTCTIRLNGKAVPVELDSSRWKQECRVEVAELLRAGQNDLAVTVSNSSGPPALWLAVSCPETIIASDASWQSSLAGATWCAAALANDPVPFGNFPPDGPTEHVVPSILKVWPFWLLFAGVSVAAILVCRRWLTSGDVLAAGSHAPALAALAHVMFGLIAVFWISLFLHNSEYIPPRCGFDASGHISYIERLQTTWSVPLPGQDWGMQHPPLFYLVAAALLTVLGDAPDTSSGILAIRLLNVVMALGNVYLVLACLRLVFPEHPRRWILGLLIAGFLPMSIYLSHYPTNHIFAGTLASLTIYAAFRIFYAPAPRCGIICCWGLLWAGHSFRS